MFDRSLIVHLFLRDKLQKSVSDARNRQEIYQNGRIRESETVATVSSIIS